jgi:hypothetical protein
MSGARTASQPWGQRISRPVSEVLSHSHVAFRSLISSGTDTLVQAKLVPESKGVDGV